MSMGDSSVAPCADKSQSVLLKWSWSSEIQQLPQATLSPIWWLVRLSQQEFWRQWETLTHDRLSKVVGRFGFFFFFTYSYWWSLEVDSCRHSSTLISSLRSDQISLGHLDCRVLAAVTRSLIQRQLFGEMQPDVTLRWPIKAGTRADQSCKTTPWWSTKTLPGRWGGHLSSFDKVKSSSQTLLCTSQLILKNTRKNKRELRLKEERERW